MTGQHQPILVDSNRPALSKIICICMYVPGFICVTYILFFGHSPNQISFLSILFGRFSFLHIKDCQLWSVNQVRITIDALIVYACSHENVYNENYILFIIYFAQRRPADVTKKYHNSLSAYLKHLPLSKPQISTLLYENKVDIKMTPNVGVVN